MLVILAEEGMQVLCSCHLRNSREVCQDLQHTAVVVAFRQDPDRILLTKIAIA